MLLLIDNRIGKHFEILHAGDCIYYDSSTPHGMIAVDGEDCAFYAIVLRNQAAREGEQAAAVATPDTKRRAPDKQPRVYRKFIDRTVEDGKLTITGGTFEKGAWSTGFRWDFEGLVKASGCAVVNTGRTAQVQVQWSSRVDTHNLVILEVVAQ
mgnify:CR=1 FL=1